MTGVVQCSSCISVFLKKSSSSRASLDVVQPKAIVMLPGQEPLLFFLFQEEVAAKVSSFLQISCNYNRMNSVTSMKSGLFLPSLESRRKYLHLKLLHNIYNRAGIDKTKYILPPHRLTQASSQT